MLSANQHGEIFACILLKVRTARAARLFFLIQPIRSLFFDVVFTVAVVFANLFDITFSFLSRIL